MGLSCTLLGHTWGDPEIIRDRSDEGEEVVIHEREVRVCDRCGNQELISENTEIRPVKPAAGDGGDGENSEDPDPEPERYQPPDGVETEDGVILEDADARDHGEWAEEAPTTTSDAKATADDSGGMEPSDDQTEILTDTDVDEPVETDAQDPDGDGDRTAGTGESPAPNQRGDSDATEEDRSTPDDGQTEILTDDGPVEDRGSQWDVDPEDLEAESSGPTVDPTAEQTVVLSDADGTASEERDQSPELVEADRLGQEDGVSLVDADPVEDADDDLEVPGGDWPETASDVSSGTTEPTDRVELVCGECTYRAPLAESSLRGGDSCPECGRAYLVEEE